jgi:hypothetical protein
VFTCENLCPIILELGGKNYVEEERYHHRSSGQGFS